MQTIDLVSYMTQALYLALWLSLPPIAVAAIVGTLFSLFQALTQIQEMTLVFVPKILAIFITMLITLPFIGAVMAGYMTHVVDLIVVGN